MKLDSAAQWQPATVGQANQETNNFADVCRSSRINETSVDAQIFEAPLMSTGRAMPLDREVDGDALIGSSLISHSLEKTDNKNGRT
jgi:hypothetical protein